MTEERLASIKYHELSSHLVHPESGYADTLTKEQLAALDEVKKQVDLEAVANERFGIPGEPVETKLLRFLRARDFDVKKTMEMLNNTLKWRRENDIDHLRDKRPADVVGMELEELFEHYPQFLIGVDKSYQPVFFRHLGKLHSQLLVRRCGIQRLASFAMWQYECGNEILAHLRAATGYHVETYVTVLDLNGMGYNAFNSDARAFLSLVASLSSDNYPETNGGMIVLNPPWWFSMAWSVVKHFLDARTQRKLIVIRDPKAELPTYMDEEYIPAEYGGKGESLSAEWPGDHTYYSWEHSIIAKRLEQQGMVSSPAKRDEVRRISQANADNEMLGKHDNLVLEVRRRSSSSGGVMGSLAHTATQEHSAASGAATAAAAAPDAAPAPTPEQ